MLNLRHLRVFETVARHENVGRASMEIHLSQPAVTRAVAKLEREVGAILFERRHSGTYLTEAGGMLRQRTARMMERMCATLRDAVPCLDEPGSARVLAQITNPHIRALSALAEADTLERAAQAIPISAAALRRVLRDLESLLGGCPLFRNSLDGAVITEPGREFAERMLLATREVESALDELRAAEGVRGGRIAIGALPMASSFLLSSVLNELAGSYPDAKIRVMDADYDQRLRMLRCGAIDFIIAHRSAEPPRDICQEPLLRDSYAVVVRHGHPLTQKKEVSAADLAAYDWIVPTHSGRRLAFEHLFEGAKRQPRITLETYSRNMIRAMLADSDRVSLLTRYEALFEERMGLITALTTTPLEPSFTLAVLMRRDWLPTPIQTRFLELLREQSRRLTAAVALPAMTLSPLPFPPQAGEG